MAPVIDRARRRFLVRGIVQGVGFRPFVYTRACALGLSGFVGNSPRGVEIETQGPLLSLDRFEQALNNEHPAMAQILEITSDSLPACREETGFQIRPSDSQGAVTTLIAPDGAVCPDCLAEMHDPDDRRHQYPFTNCTQCGPRYTITRAIPYDRPQTTMASFAMCDQCRAEYLDPENRRFHAQPNCCPACGPHLTLILPDGGVLAKNEAALAETRGALRQGKIVAIKGLGGFHLAVTAGSEEAVARLRARKGREEKPLAIMVANLDCAEGICFLSPADRSLLGSAASPIVLSEKRPTDLLAGSVAPAASHFGVMLPYTPLHHLLFQEGISALVMTSANPSGEPLCINNNEAMRRLAGIADLLLIHDRDIFQPNDDSVVITIAGRPRFLRRSRGYVPRPVIIADTGAPVLAVGAELKNSICLLQGREALLSQHLGDLRNLPAHTLFQQSIDHLRRIFTCRPDIIAHDLHPDYLSSRWAEKQNGSTTVAIQHHHAHLAACLAENRCREPAIGIILDGTGLGHDGTIWGGEILIGDCRDSQRFGHLQQMPLAGGDRAIAEPWRAALGYLYSAFGQDIPDLPFLAEHKTSPVLEILAKRVSCPVTSSCGRLFDAVAAMAGGRQRVSYEAQAAIEFMQDGGEATGKPFAWEITEQKGVQILLLEPLIRTITQALQNGESRGAISRRFHATLAAMFTAAAVRARRKTGIKTVALSGGVFQNQVLLPAMLEALTRQGFNVLTHSLVPANDGGISLGQALAARLRVGDN